MKGPRRAHAVARGPGAAATAGTGIKPSRRSDRSDYFERYAPRIAVAANTSVLQPPRSGGTLCLASRGPPGRE